MKLFGTTIISLILVVNLFGQVDISHLGIAINECNPLSDLAVNSVGDSKYAAYIVADEDVSSGSAVYAKAYPITSFGGFTFGVVGDSNIAASGNRAIGLFGSAIRDMPSNDGRSIGVLGYGGDSTPGANYGVLGRLYGSSAGAGVVGYDSVANPGWSEVLPPTETYAGYFHGNVYLKDNLSIGNPFPTEKLHVQGGNIYVEDPAAGIIFNTGSGCYLMTVDPLGAMTTTSIPCP